jgi:hypothetical protein
VPGLLATVGLAGLAILLVFDLLALRRGAVPGGLPLVVATFALAALAGGYAGLVMVAVGRREGRQWGAALRDAASVSVARPVALPAATGVVILTVLLAVLVHPALIPVLAGCALFALHAVVRALNGATEQADPATTTAGPGSPGGAPGTSSPE